MKRTILTLVVFACISQGFCEVIWNSPTDGSTITVQEDENAGFVVASFDATASGDISYGVVSESPDENKFGIQNSNELYLKSTLDYENVQNYTVVIKAQDTTSNDQADITLYVKVIDVNDEEPVITSAASVDIPTNTALEAVVYTVTSEDPDTVGTVTYSIISGNENNDFSITESTGIIILKKALNISVTEEYDIVISVTDGVHVVTHRVTFYLTNVIWQTPQEGQTDLIPEDTAEDTVLISLQAENAFGFTFTVEPDDEKSKFRTRNTGLTLEQALDYETTKSYTFIIKAQGSGYTADVTYILNITDINDEPPVFAIETDTIDLSRQTNIGNIVYTAVATDQDTVGILSYSIKSGNTGNTFSINNATGEVTLDAPLDPDTTASYGLVIEVSDGVATAQMTLTITVNKIVWTDPVKGEPESLSENTAVNSVIKNLAADTALSYLITGQSPTPGKFGIFNTSELFLLSALDYETITSYTISLRAIDGDGKTADIVYILNVTDVNDVSPKFVSGTFVLIPENIEVGTVLYVASATDKDTVGSLAYSITGGNDDGTFSIDADSGNLTLAKALTPATNSDLSYSLIIGATDSVHPVTQTLAISVKSVPEVTLPENGVSITENVDTSGPYEVLTLESSDLDNDPNPTYSIDSQSHDSTFAISDDNSKLITTAEFDREATAEYNVTIRVTDKSQFSLSSATTLTVTILDENDVAPTFTSNDTLDLADDTELGVTVYTATTTDPDILGTTTYKILAGDFNNDFDMSTDGTITLNKALDAGLTPTYTLKLAANDTKNETPFNLTVRVVTEPQISLPAGNIEIAESDYTGMSKAVWTLSSTDVDGDTDPVYSILGQSDAGTFELSDDNTQLVTSAKLDYESVQNYTVWLSVTDTSSLERSSSENITVHVTDVNDEPPVFATPSETLELREDTEIGLF